MERVIWFLSMRVVSLPLPNQHVYSVTGNECDSAREQEN